MMLPRGMQLRDLSLTVIKEELTTRQAIQRTHPASKHTLAIKIKPKDIQLFDLTQKRLKEK